MLLLACSHGLQYDIQQAGPQHSLPRTSDHDDVVVRVLPPDTLNGARLEVALRCAGHVQALHVTQTVWQRAAHEHMLRHLDGLRGVSPIGSPTCSAHLLVQWEGREQQACAG